LFPIKIPLLFTEKICYISVRGNGDMQKSIKDKIYHRIRGHERGWAFSAVDFMADFNRVDTDTSLSLLVKEGKIRRVMHGIYDYPKYSDLLKRLVAPDIYQIANAIARKFSWRIHPEGNTALNYLGLSTQVAAKNIYLSDGPKRKYKIGNTALEFKPTAIKEAALKHPETSLVVQALKSWGEANIDEVFLKKLSAKYTLKEWRKIKRDATKTTGWVYKAISTIASDMEDKNHG
jgi:hypothetical protein